MSAVSPEAREAAQLRAQVSAMEQLLDIQEKTVAEQSQRLEFQAAELRRSNHALEQFAYVISHDLQEPLRMVAAYTELLREAYRGKLGADADKYIDFASGGARRMQELINALLDYSRITTRGSTLQPIDMERIVDEAKLNLELAIEESGATIEVGPLPRVLGDRPQLVRVVQNLLANAIKFRKEGTRPTIRVDGRVEGPMVRVAVADDGIGIEPRHHARIFEVFRRIHPKRYPGTGIGLSICQRVVERHGGTIHVESDVGKGATFVFTLPSTATEGAPA